MLLACHTFMWSSHHGSRLMQSLAHRLCPHAEVPGDLLAAPAVGVELGCFPRLFFCERWGCGVDAAGAEEPAHSAPVDAEAIGELVDAGASLVLLGELVDFVDLELAEGLEGRGWHRGACAVRRTRPGLGEIKKPLNGGGRV